MPNDASVVPLGLDFLAKGSALATLPDLGSRISRHSKGNSEGEKNERPIHRVLTRGRFRPLADISEVVEKLFG